MMAYCIDLRTSKITKFDCSCAPRGYFRHEFYIDSEDKDEILEKARLVLNSPEAKLVFCEHF